MNGFQESQIVLSCSVALKIVLSKELNQEKNRPENNEMETNTIDGKRRKLLTLTIITKPKYVTHKQN